MTPAQKLVLEAKLSSQRVNQFAAWLEQNRIHVGEGEAGLRESLRMLVGRFDGVQAAIDAPPTIGVIGEVGSGKTQLVKALTAPGEGERSRASEAEIIRNILLNDADLRCAAALRFRAAPPPGAAREHPFRLGLLSLADLAAIMARIYCTGCPKSRVAIPRLDRIAAIYDEVSRNLQAGMVPGFTDRDVFALRDTLDSQFPEADSLKLLAAAGYWNDLAEVAAHITDADRLKVLALLWGEEQQITRLFTLLGDALARLGFVTEAFCPREALIELDATSGWLRRHAESIIDVETLSRLGDETGASLHVVGRYGQGATISRAVMAALVADLSLIIPSGALAAIKPTEIIDFPSFMPAGEMALGLGVMDFPGVDLPRTATSAGNADAAGAAPNGATGRQRGSTTGCSREQLVRLFAHAKAAHLFDRACQRNEVTSLIVCVDPDGPVNDTLQPAIADWIDFAQGFDPQTREQRRTGLLVVAADVNGRQNGAGGQADPPLIDERGMARDLIDAVAGDENWPLEWTPGRPFLNVVAVGAGSRTERTTQPLRIKPALPVATAGTSSNGSDPAHSAGSAGGLAGGLAGGYEASAFSVLRAVAEASHTSTKQRHLRRQLGDLHRRLRSRFLRYHIDGELIEWRQRVAATIEHRLYRVVRRGRLGLLIKSLMVGEREMYAIYQRKPGQSIEDQLADATALSSVIDVEPMSRLASEAAMTETVGGIGLSRIRAARLAESAVSHWHSAMRRTARAARLCRAIGLGEALLEHIVDEIAIAATRLGLVRHVEAAILTGFAAGGLRHSPDTATADSDARAISERIFAGAVIPVINGFVETLELEDVQADDRLAGAMHHRQIGVPASGQAGIAWQEPAMFANRLSDRWCAALSRLIDANISASRLHPGGSHSADLGRLLAQVPNTHIEVEL